MSDALHAVMKADRTVYSKVVINRLVNEEKIGNQNAGNHQIEINGSSLDAGVYYFTLRVGNSAVTEKLIVTK